MIHTQELAVDTLCRSCQYNLRGMRADALCPECGTPVAVSLRDDRLQFSRPDWLITLRRGLLIYVTSWFLTLPFFAMIFIADRGPARTELWAPAGSLFLSLVSIAGMWLATTPDPSGRGENIDGKIRRLIRVGLVVSAINHLSQFPLRIVRYLPPVLLWVNSIEMSAVTLFVVVCFLLYLSRLGLRLPDDRLYRLARFLMFAVGVTSGSSTVFNIVSRMWMGRVAAGTLLKVMHYLWIPSLVFGLSGIVLGIMQVVLCLKLVKRLRETITLARQHTQLVIPADALMPPKL